MHAKTNQSATTCKVSREYSYLQTLPSTFAHNSSSSPAAPGWDLVSTNVRDTPLRCRYQDSHRDYSGMHLLSSIPAAKSTAWHYAAF